MKGWWVDLLVAYSDMKKFNSIIIVGLLILLGISVFGQWEITNLQKGLNSTITDLENIKSTILENQGASSQLQNEIETQNEFLNKQGACIKADSLLTQIKDVCGSTPFQGIDWCIAKRTEFLNKGTNVEGDQERIRKMRELEPQYLEAKNICEN